jgi:hypothetical protein
MEKLQEYQNVISEGNEFLYNHDQLLQSLQLSKQHVADNTFAQETPGIGNESVEPG